MALSTTYIQPVIEWLRYHPDWTSLIVFFISFLESLAIIGSIVPGSVMMTMVGILAGTGVIGLKSAVFSAILGAIAGDGGSYFLGYYFSERLALLWPFSRYPNWLSYGKTYFERHGGKSVFLGRFVGPLRSIIPAIAGMMKMKHLNFFMANACSAIGWSVLYMGPGILVGVASATLSAETATRLFLIIIGFLFTLWLLGIGVKKLWAHLRDTLNQLLHTTWCRAKKITSLKPIVAVLTPPNEIQHAQTFSLLLLCIFLTVCSMILTRDISRNLISASFDLPIYFFLQSIRTHAFDAFFTIMLLAISPIAILTIILAQIAYAAFTQHFRLVKYWMSLCFCTFILLLCFDHYLFHHSLERINTPEEKLFVPAHYLTFAATVFSFFVLNTRQYCMPMIQKIIKWTISFLIIFASIALLYLGENWFSSVLTALSVGFCLSLIHWLFYRRIETPNTYMSLLIVFIAYGLVFINIVFFNFNHTLSDHTPRDKQYMLTHQAWWEQSQPLLPMYSSNRLGRPDGLFNIQYLGSIEHLKQALTTDGWEKQSTSFVENIIARTGKNKAKLPIRGQFYLNRKPDLVMSYGRKGAKPVLILSLWRSNFHLLYHYHPLWIGTIQPYQAPQLKSKPATFVMIPFNPLLHALHDFKIRTLNLTNTELLGYGASVKLLIIQD